MKEKQLKKIWIDIKYYMNSYKNPRINKQSNLNKLFENCQNKLNGMFYKLKERKIYKFKKKKKNIGIK